MARYDFISIESLLFYSIPFYMALYDFISTLQVLSHVRSWEGGDNATERNWESGRRSKISQYTVIPALMPVYDFLMPYDTSVALNTCSFGCNDTADFTFPDLIHAYGNISFAEVVAFGPKLLKNFATQVYVDGNVEQAYAKEILDVVRQTLNSP